VSGVSTLILQDIGGTAAFSRPVDVATLIVPATVNGVSLTGATGTVTNPITFANTGPLTLGTAGGTLTFGSDLTASTPASIVVNGPIAAGGAIELTAANSLSQLGSLTTTRGAVALAAGAGGITMASGTTTSTSPGPGSIHYTASGPITLASLVCGGDVVVETTAGSIVALPGQTNVTAGGALSLAAFGGSVGTAAEPVSVAIDGNATMNATGMQDGVSRSPRPGPSALSYRRSRPRWWARFSGTAST
jgi:hypothetical protein